MTDMIAPRPSTPQANQIMQMNTREMQRRDAADDAVRNVEYVPTGNVTSSLKGTWNLLDGHLYSSERKDGVLYLDLEMKERIERQQDASLGHGDYLFVEVGVLWWGVIIDWVEWQLAIGSMMREANADSLKLLLLSCTTIINVAHLKMHL